MKKSGVNLKIFARRIDSKPTNNMHPFYDESMCIQNLMDMQLTFSLDWLLRESLKFQSRP